MKHFANFTWQTASIFSGSFVCSILQKSGFKSTAAFFLEGGLWKPVQPEVGKGNSFDEFSIRQIPIIRVQRLIVL